MGNETMLSNVINPQVMGPMINAKIEALLKITPYAKVDTTLVGVPGDTKTVPSWSYIGDAEDVAEGAEVGLSQLTASSTTFSIKKAMKAVGITEEARLSGLGNPIGQAETQLAKAIAGKVDNDVFDAAMTSKNIVDNTSGAIKYAGIVDAVAKFEDEEDGVDKVMFIHPNQEAKLLKDPDFLSADKFQSGVAVNGAIGKIAGCWVKKSKKVKLIKYEKDEAAGTITIVADDVEETETEKHLSTVRKNAFEQVAVGNKVKVLADSAQYYVNPIIKNEPDDPETEYTEDELPALTIFLKKDTMTTSEYKHTMALTEIVSVKFYGVALTNEAKVVLAKFKK